MFMLLTKLEVKTLMWLNVLRFDAKKLICVINFYLFLYAFLYNAHRFINYLCLYLTRQIPLRSQISLSKEAWV